MTGSISTSRVRTSPGFTLVELLVVLAVISVLVAMLLPALGKARASSQRVHCASNLRQISTSMLLFAHDHKGHLPNVMGAKRDDGINVRWFGGVNKKNEFIAEVALLQPYWRKADIGGCYSFEFDDVRPFYGPVDYAYSSILGIQNGGTPPFGVKLTQVRRTSETVMLFDSARVNNWHYTPARLDRSPWGYPPSRRVPSFHGRHNGLGNVAWVDGHVSLERPVQLPGGIPVPLQRQHSVGDIDSDNDPATDELFDLQ